MLVILAPEEIPKYWDEVKYYIESSLPIHQQYGYSMPKILMNILGGVLLVSYFADNTGRIIGVFTLTVRRDTITEVNTLEILTGYSERILTKEEMENMMTSIRKLAESKGCKNILFYTDIKNSIQMFKEAGATLHGHLIMEV